MVIKKVLISGGREVGGLASFAGNLLDGFRQLGIGGNVVSLRDLLLSWSELRDPHVLKILSTTAVFLAPLCRNSICVAHGFPRADAQGKAKTAGIVFSLRVAQRYSRLVSVSHYVKIHLKAVFNIRSCAAIHNPLSSAYLSQQAGSGPRRYITYVGRLHEVKNIHRLIEPVRRVLDQNPHMQCLIIGEGVMHAQLQQQIRGDGRFLLKGAQHPEEIRKILAQTELFFSGCETEALGIAYLEALSQGCKVVMPASGGGIEIDVARVGDAIFLLPLDFDGEQCSTVISRALHHTPSTSFSLHAFAPSEVARRYLDIAQ